jgi:hypothetical protein
MVQNRHVLLKQTRAKSKHNLSFAVKLTYVAAGLVAGSYEISLFVVWAIVFTTRIIINTHFNTQYLNL